MCWNAKVSLNTFLFSLFGISFAYFNNVIGFFEFLYFLSFISMQLLEYFTWNYLHNKNMNKFLSKIGLFLLFIQVPLFILSCNKVDDKLKSLLLGVYLIFSVFSIFYFPVDFSMNKASNGHLAWNWLLFPNIVIFIWILFQVGLFFYQKEYTKFILFLIIVSSIYYTYYKTNTWGSLWCWIANLLALKLILQVFLRSDPSNCLLYKHKCK